MYEICLFSLEIYLKFGNLILKILVFTGGGRFKFGRIRIESQRRGQRAQNGIRSIHPDTSGNALQEIEQKHFQQGLEEKVRHTVRRRPHFLPPQLKRLHVQRARQGDPPAVRDGQGSGAKTSRLANRAADESDRFRRHERLGIRIEL